MWMMAWCRLFVWVVWIVYMSDGIAWNICMGDSVVWICQIHDGVVTRASSIVCHYLGTTRGGAYFRLGCLCCFIIVKPA